jgi:hypothetical protein
MLDSVGRGQASGELCPSSSFAHLRLPSFGSRLFAASALALAGRMLAPARPGVHSKIYQNVAGSDAEGQDRKSADGPNHTEEDQQECGL